MGVLKNAFLEELKIFRDGFKRDVTFFDKFKRSWYLIDRLHSETNKYTLYWNGKKIVSKTESADFYYYHDALNAFKQRLLSNSSNYIELVECKKNGEIKSIIRISV